MCGLGSFPEEGEELGNWGWGALEERHPLRSAPPEPKGQRLFLCLLPPVRPADPLGCICPFLRCPSEDQAGSSNTAPFSSRPGLEDEPSQAKTGRATP